MSSTAKSILITASTGKIPLSTAKSIIVTQSIAGTSAFLIKKCKQKRRATIKPENENNSMPALK